MNGSGNSGYFRHKLDIDQTHMKLISDSLESLTIVRNVIIHNRNLLERYIQQHPEFHTSLEPIELDFLAPEFIREMMRAGLAAGVGPMASVAGGLAEIATSAMIKSGCKLALADNGGDISVMGERNFTVGVYAGERSVAQNVGFKVKSGDLPLGICTSAGVLGHSISFGDADGVVVFSRSTFLADAAATSVANQVKRSDPEGTIQNGLELAEEIEGVLGCMIFIEGKIGTTGWLPEIVELIIE